mmetsp:Transcript_24087/g.36597  ORF Transcript_24087/g.36597 Transcript_24087/m.36597 type:complete len:131 (-) Transcript_24087:1064-1456(-)
MFVLFNLVFSYLISGAFDFGHLLDEVQNISEVANRPADVASHTGESFVAVSGEVSGSASLVSSLGGSSPRNGPSEIVLVGDNMDLCLGMIGKGETVCIDKAGTCPIESHQLNRPTALEQCLLIKKSPKAA